VAETKPKSADSLRTPKPKKKLGLAVPPALRLPHEDLITSSHKEATPKEFPDQASTPRQLPESSDNTMPTQTRQTSHTTQTSLSSLSSMTSHTRQATPVSPVRDFTKFANSIHREAVPGGLFRGKGKQLYDCLYSLSRGAVVPSRTIRISRPRLMKIAGIGARVTFDANIDRLAAVGLIQVRRIAGEHDGNEYTVLLPEELSMTSLTRHTSETSHAQNPVRLDGLESSQTSHSLSIEDTAASGESKTSFKTKDIKTDDEAFAKFVASVRNATKEITGKEPSVAEAERWAELADVLITELKIAAGRTTVSNVPAFLAEHLRRRLWKKEKRQIEAEAAEQKGSALVPKVDASKCPDCFGTGMHYPEGYDKGVAKCPHSRLITEGSK
jgi:hypothetical protein